MVTFCSAVTQASASSSRCSRAANSKASAAAAASRRADRRRGPTRPRPGHDRGPPPSGRDRRARRPTRRGPAPTPAGCRRRATRHRPAAAPATVRTPPGAPAGRRGRGRSAARRAQRRPVHDRQPGAGRLAEPVQTSFSCRRSGRGSTAAGPPGAGSAPARPPRGGVADDGLKAGDARHHRRQVTSVAEVTPVRDHTAAQANGPPQVEHPAGRVAEPVHARRGGQPQRPLARLPADVVQSKNSQSFARTDRGFPAPHS